MTDVPTILSRLAPLPTAEFSQFGEVEVKPLPRLQKLTGAVLGRNWVVIPHVTHYDEVDTTEAEERRATWNRAHPNKKLTPIVVLIKALVETLRVYPEFNSSLSEDGNSIIFKKYFNIGIAVDTPNGLLVPVIVNSDKKSVSELASELATIAEKARTKGLSMKEMSGSSMCITSIGHVGGIAFTPIINAPDTAILGVTRQQERATRGKDNQTEWRKMLPLSLSYDHRVINGVVAARFVQRLGHLLASKDFLDNVFS